MIAHRFAWATNVELRSSAHQLPAVTVRKEDPKVPRIELAAAGSLTIPQVKKYIELLQGAIEEAKKP